MSAYYVKYAVRETGQGKYGILYNEIYTMHRKSDGIHVGSLTLRCGDKPTIIGIGIKDEFKRQGLGTDFVKQVCELTGNATLYVVETNIVGDNAKQFFQKLQDHEKRIKIIT